MQPRAIRSSLKGPLVSDPSYGQTWPQQPEDPTQQHPAPAYPPQQQPGLPAAPGQPYSPAPGYLQQPAGYPPAPGYPPQPAGYPPHPHGAYSQMGYPQQPYGQQPVNVNVQQQGPGVSYTREYIGAGFHIWNITLTICTGFLWAPVYALLWYLKSRPKTVTTHYR